MPSQYFSSNIQVLSELAKLFQPREIEKNNLKIYLLKNLNQIIVNLALIQALAQGMSHRPIVMNLSVLLALSKQHQYAMSRS